MSTVLASKRSVATVVILFLCTGIAVTLAKLNNSTDIPDPIRSGEMRVEPLSGQMSSARVLRVEIPLATASKPSSSGSSIPTTQEDGTYLFQKNDLAKSLSLSIKHVSIAATVTPDLHVLSMVAAAISPVVEQHFETFFVPLQKKRGSEILSFAEKTMLLRSAVFYGLLPTLPELLDSGKIKSEVVLVQSNGRGVTFTLDKPREVLWINIFTPTCTVRFEIPKASVKSEQWIEMFNVSEN